MNRPLTPEQVFSANIEPLTQIIGIDDANPQVAESYCKAAIAIGIPTYPNFDLTPEPLYLQNTHNLALDDPDVPMNESTFYLYSTSPYPQANGPILLPRPVAVQASVLANMEQRAGRLAALIAVQDSGEGEGTPHYAGENATYEIGALILMGGIAVRSSEIETFSPRVPTAIQEIVAKYQRHFPLLHPGEMRQMNSEDIDRIVRTCKRAEPDLNEQEAIRQAISDHLTELDLAFPLMPKLCRVDVASVQPGKGEGAKAVARGYERGKSATPGTVAIRLHRHDLPSGIDRSDWPLNENSKDGPFSYTREAAEVRIAQLHIKLEQEIAVAQPGVDWLLVALESGGDYNDTDRKHIRRQEASGCVAEDVLTDKRSTAMSDPVELYAADMRRLRAAQRIKGGIVGRTPGKVVMERLAKQGIAVDHQEYYRAPRALKSGGNHSRAFYLVQASYRAAASLALASKVRD